MPLQQIAINFPPIPVFSVQTDSFVSATFLRYAETAENIPIFQKICKKIRPGAEMHQSGLLVSVI
jgi:hypothetical protein